MGSDSCFKRLLSPFRKGGVFPATPAPPSAARGMASFIDLTDDFAGGAAGSSGGVLMDFPVSKERETIPCMDFPRLFKKRETNP